MLNRKELEGYRAATDLNLGQIEKDYVQHVFLMVLYRRIGREIVFKGGTALQKVYGLNRFSEDLDFTQQEDMDIHALCSGIAKDLLMLGFNSAAEVRKDSEREAQVIFKINGPLYTGSEQSKVTLRLDISRREKIASQDIREIVPIYRDLGPYTTIALNMDEILSEKIRALLTRSRPRDLYDIWFLLKKGAKMEIGLVNAKLSYYGKEYDNEEMKKAVDNLRGVWEKDLGTLIDPLPDYEAVAKFVSEKLGIQPPR